MMRATTVLLSLALVHGTARAELSAPAKARLDVGLVHYNAGHYEAAIVEFEAAYEIDPDPSLLFTWAQAERLADHCASALPRYRQFLESRPSAEAAALANNGIALCEAKSSATPGCEPDASLPWYKNPAGGAVVGGVIVTGIGIGFLFAASGNRDSADHATTSDAFETYLDRATTQRRVGALFLVIGVGLTGGGIGYHYYTKSKRTKGPVVGTTGTSLFIAGEF